MTASLLAEAPPFYAESLSKLWAVLELLRPHPVMSLRAGFAQQAHQIVSEMFHSIPLAQAHFDELSLAQQLDEIGAELRELM